MQGLQVASQRTSVQTVEPVWFDRNTTEFLLRIWREERVMTEAIIFLVGIGTGVIISSLAMLVALATDWMRMEE